LGVLNNVKACNPNELAIIVLLSDLFRSGGHFGRVNEYIPNANAIADAI
jgi:hypothetical protein